MRSDSLRWASSAPVAAATTAALNAGNLRSNSPAPPETLPETVSSDDDDVARVGAEWGADEDDTVLHRALHHGLKYPVHGSVNKTRRHTNYPYEN